MFEHNDIRTPAELKSFAGNHYKKLYETELSKLDILNDKFKNIIKNKEKFSKDEYIKRVEHYEKTISTQEEIVKRYKGGYEFFMSSVNSIDNIFFFNLVLGFFLCSFGNYLQSNNTKQQNEKGCN